MRLIPRPAFNPACGLALASVLLAMPRTAVAQESFPIEVCNQSGYSAAVALSYQRDQERGTDYWFHEGWKIIESGECVEVGSTPNRYLYLFATERNNPDTRWEGDFDLCVQYPGPYEFVLHRDSDCPGNAEVEPFSQYYIDEGYNGFKLTLE